MEDIKNHLSLLSVTPAVISWQQLIKLMKVPWIKFALPIAVLSECSPFSSSQLMRFFMLLSPPVLLRKGVRERLSGRLATSQGRPTILVLNITPNTQLFYFYIKVRRQMKLEIVFLNKIWLLGHCQFQWWSLRYQHDNEICLILK